MTKTIWDTDLVKALTTKFADFEFKVDLEDVRVIVEKNPIEDWNLTVATRLKTHDQAYRAETITLEWHEIRSELDNLVSEFLRRSE